MAASACPAVLAAAAARRKPAESASLARNSSASRAGSKSFCAMTSAAPTRA